MKGKPLAYNRAKDFLRQLWVLKKRIDILKMERDSLYDTYKSIDYDAVRVSAQGDASMRTFLRLEEKMIIRKLTPKECFRLMGVKDEDFENVARNQSDSSLYHLAGDSIVVNVLMAIFSQMIEREQ